MDTEPVIYHGRIGQVGETPLTLDLTINAARTYHFVLDRATPVAMLHVPYFLQHPDYSFTRASPTEPGQVSRWDTEDGGVV